MTSQSRQSTDTESEQKERKLWGIQVTVPDSMARILIWRRREPGNQTNSHHRTTHPSTSPCDPISMFADAKRSDWFFTLVENLHFMRNIWCQPMKRLPLLAAITFKICFDLGPLIHTIQQDLKQWGSCFYNLRYFCQEGDKIKSCGHPCGAVLLGDWPLNTLWDNEVKKELKLLDEVIYRFRSIRTISLRLKTHKQTYKRSSYRTP